MTIQIYRAYNSPFNDVVEGEDYTILDYAFSIVARENGFQYACTDSYSNFLNQDRINMVIDINQKQGLPTPTTPLDWAILACDNLDGYDVLPYPSSEWIVPYTDSDEDFQNAINDEINVGLDAENFRQIAIDGNIKAKAEYEASKTQPVTAAVASCPPATQDIELNLENRQKAIAVANYGPMNPELPNDEYWSAKAERWKTTPEEIKQSVCGNCAFFIQTPTMLNCIESGLGNEQGNDAWGSINAGDLGYCEAFDFKCASARTCDAWVTGGPITEEEK